MSSCKKYRKSVGLYLFDELTPDERIKFEEHLRNCQSCQQELAFLTGLKQPMLEVDSWVVQSNRRELFAHIRRKSRHPSHSFEFGWNWGKRILQAGVAVLFITFGFTLGILKNQSVSHETDLGSLLTLSQGYQMKSGTITPYSIGVEDIDLDEETGSIVVNLFASHKARLELDRDDPNLQWIVDQALRDDTNPALRLHAIKTIQVIAQSQDSLSYFYLDVLEQVLVQEENQGIVFAALKTLGTVRSQNRAQDLLLQYIYTSQEEPLKIQAFMALVDEKPQYEGLKDVLAATKYNSNPYIKTKSLELLGKGRSL